MIDILVPVLGRPWNAQPFFESVTAASSIPHRVLFLCSPGDTEQIAACQRTGAEVIVVGWEAGRADFARKINAGFQETDEEWVFQGADDIRFSPGWDVQALQVAAQTGKSVIGTNDLHNPGVLRRMHATHILFKRSYIEEQGGTLDGSGTVFSEVYDHQFVDTEFIDTAKRRREWAFAQNSVVEHFHPYFGGAEMDDTYRKALRETGPDHALYLLRVRAVKNSPARAR